MKNKDEEEKKNGESMMNGKHNNEGGEIYRTTSVIHAIRCESKERENIQTILKILLKTTNLQTFDSLGRDAFMYIAIRNHQRTFSFII